MTDEFWVDVVGYEGLYKVSTFGRVKSVRRRVPHRHIMMLVSEKILKQYIDRGGRCYVNLSKDGVESNLMVHALVLTAFIGPRPEGMECCHYPDRNQTNNQIDNLRWDTSHENHMDMKLQGSSCRRKSYENVPRGEGHPFAKLTEETVREIKQALKSAKRGDGRKLAKKFNIAEATICDIKKGRLWKHVAV